MSHQTHDQPPPNWLKTKLSSWFWRLTPACREVARLTSEEHDHPLPLLTRLQLRLHRRFCKWCARYARQLELMHEASHLFPEHTDQIEGPTLGNDAKARMKQALQQKVDGEA